MHGSLLSREMPLAAPAPAVASLPEKLPAGIPPSIPQSAPVLSARNTRPLKKPARSSNIFMFSLAVLFLAGFVAAAAWMFREPLMEVVNRLRPQPKEVVAQIPSAASAESGIPETSSGSPVKPDAEPEPSTATAATPPTPGRGSFNPEAPQISGTPAQKVTPEEIAALQSLPKPAIPTPPSVASSGQGLMEVPSKPMTPSLQNGSEPTQAESLAMPSSKDAPKIEVTEEAKPAADALLKFLNAEDLKERLRYTLAASSMKPIMERYYQAQPEGPVRVDSIGLVRYDPKPQMGGGAHVVFGVESRTWEYPVPVMLEETKEGFQVDWLSFVEFKDRLLEKFFEGYQEGPARFHVGITRTHYFEDKVPNSGNKDAFRISPAPPNPYLTTVFVEKDSQVGRELKDRIPWGSQVWAIVELEWVKLGTQQWVQLAAVPQLNWYSVPTETKSSEAKSKTGRNSGPPDEVQRAVPVGR